MRGEEAGRAGLPGQGKAASGRGDTELSAQPCTALSLRTPSAAVPAVVAQGRLARADRLGDCPTPSHTAQPPDTAVPTAGTAREGLIRESHPSTALLRGKQLWAPSNTCQPWAHGQYPPWPCCGVAGSRGTAQGCGREQGDSTAPVATPVCT